MTRWVIFSNQQMLADIGRAFSRGEPVYDLTFENVQAGERTSHLSRIANFVNGLVVGTGYLSEFALGFTRYGIGPNGGKKTSCRISKPRRQIAQRCGSHCGGLCMFRSIRRRTCLKTKSACGWSPLKMIGAAHGRGYSAETSGAGPGPSATVTVGLPAYYQFNYGDLNRDIRHNLQVTAIFELPFGKDKPWIQSGPLAQIFGGWQINSVLSAYTGSPFTAIADNSTLNSSASTQRADCVSAKPHKRGDIYQWYDRSDFRVPAAGRFGTCGVNTLRGPGLVNLDTGLDRKWRFGEQSELKFRVESFNVANTPHHSNPGSGNSNNNVNTGGFMEALGIRNTGRDGLDERTFRVGLKFNW